MQAYIYCKNLLPPLKPPLWPQTQFHLVKASLRMYHEWYIDQSPGKALDGISFCCSYSLLQKKLNTIKPRTNPRVAKRLVSSCVACGTGSAAPEQPGYSCGRTIKLSQFVRLLSSEQERSADHCVYNFPLSPSLSCVWQKAFKERS